MTDSSTPPEVTYVSVAEADSIPIGTGRTIHVRGREFALYNVDGSFHAIDDVCPHRGASLGSGTLEGRTVYCPLHGWAFDIVTGVCSSREDRPVRSYPTRVVAGEVQILI
jgi:nitrite reductase (NADH) small subunit